MRARDVAPAFNLLERESATLAPDQSGGESATEGHHLRHWNIRWRNQYASEL
jgi:hypothetical protein